MDEKTIQIIKERFDSLPESIQELIFSDHYQNTLIEVGKKHGLNIEQLGIIEKEVTMVLMGLVPPNDFRTDLAGQLKVGKEKGIEIAQDISGNVFAQVKELIELMNTPVGQDPVIDRDEIEVNTSPAVAVKTPAGYKPDYADTLLGVSRKHELSVTQMGVLENLVKEVVVGTGDATKFEQALEKGAWLSREKAHAVTVDVNEKVFKSIRKEMMASDTLKSAGIDILPQKPKVEFQTSVTKNDREEMLKKIENPNLINGPKELEAPHQIHQQKLAGSFSLPQKETAYEPKKEPLRPGVDPYRETPK